MWMDTALQLLITSLVKGEAGWGRGVCGRKVYHTTSTLSGPAPKNAALWWGTLVIVACKGENSRRQKMCCPLSCYGETFSLDDMKKMTKKLSGWRSEAQQKLKRKDIVLYVEQKGETGRGKRTESGVSQVCRWLSQEVFFHSLFFLKSNLAHEATHSL